MPLLPNRFHLRPHINRCKDRKFLLNNSRIKINFRGDFADFSFFGLIVVFSWKSNDASAQYEFHIVGFFEIKVNTTSEIFFSRKDLK
jgi:hypothetical protein